MTQFTDRERERPSRLSEASLRINESLELALIHREERARGCGWVLRCSWDNGFVRITSQPQGAPIRCYQRATPTG